MSLVGSSCATSASKPQGLREHFVTGKDVRYASERYVTGVGQGSDVGQARANAFADIGAQIQSKIESTLVSHEQAVSGAGTGAAISRVTNDVRQHVTFDHRGIATVADTQVEDGTVHVFAALDRAAAAEPFRRDVAKIGGLLRRALDDFAAAETRLDLRAAGSLAKEIRARGPELAAALVLFEATTAVLPTGDDWAEVARAAQIDADLRRLRGKASVEVCVTPAADFPEGSQLVQAMTERIASLGVAALPCSKRRDSVTLRAEGRISAIFSTDVLLPGAVFCRPSVDLRLLDVRSGAEVLSGSLGGDAARAGGRDREAATRAALKQLTALSLPPLAQALGEVP